MTPAEKERLRQQGIRLAERRRQFDQWYSPHLEHIKLKSEEYCNSLTTEVINIHPAHSIKQRYHVSKRLELAMPLSIPAGATLAFPPRQILPSEWFGGEEVVLYFKEDAGIWKVYQHGWLEDLLLYLWSYTGQQIGPPLRVGNEPTRLPVTDPEELYLIEVGLATP